VAHLHTLQVCKKGRGRGSSIRHRRTPEPTGGIHSHFPNSKYDPKNTVAVGLAVLGAIVAVRVFLFMNFRRLGTSGADFLGKPRLFFRPGPSRNCQLCSY
jgi:hypothetical protein